MFTVARHGFRQIDAESRIKTYNATTAGSVDRFDGAEYANVDTLFSLGETYLFCQLVELKERLTESGSVRLSFISVLVRAICITSSVLFHSYRMPSRRRRRR